MKKICRWFIEPRTNAANESLASFLTSLGVTLSEGTGTMEGSEDRKMVPQNGYEFPGFLLTRILDRVWSDKEFKVRIFRRHGNNGPLEECSFLLKRRQRHAPAKLVTAPPRTSAAA